jgi:hypothetical protein
LREANHALSHTTFFSSLSYIRWDVNERLKCNRAGQVVLQLKSAFKDGTTHIVMSPLEFMQRLADDASAPIYHSPMAVQPPRVKVHVHFDFSHSPVQLLRTENHLSAFDSRDTRHRQSND